MKNHHYCKLTQILKDSLGDGSKVFLLVHISPCEEDVGKTTCSLIFAKRCTRDSLHTLEIGVSSTIDGEEILNAETVTANARDRFSFGVSARSVGMGASHEAEIHGTGSVVGDAEPIAEVTENQGQTGKSIPDPGLMGEFIPEEVDIEDPQGDSHDMMSRSVRRDDSGSKVDGLFKADSVESGEKISQNRALVHDSSAHPSLSCNAIVYFGYEVSKDEVTQAGKQSVNEDSTFLESDYVAANGIYAGDFEHCLGYISFIGTTYSTSSNPFWSASLAFRYPFSLTAPFVTSFIAK
ncbi:hypothetical protein IFM89_004927 [Coptis chinensis]|uniref:Kinesin motor domain-containing protein n=1 Tax=Coptis chinensis TaxID=261450 RepID=A0A835HSV7_9MAGN|nr:hypothetical protein IFM89_004927 [Coptis chinensis]